MMSNTVNNNEIDEVMSSVRKLVSNKDRAEKKMADNDDQPSRFLLSEAFRVEEDPKEEVVEVPPQVQETGVMADNVLVLDPGNRTELAGLEATIAELEAAVTAQTDNFEPDEGEPLTENDWAESAFATPEATSFFEGSKETVEAVADTTDLSQLQDTPQVEPVFNDDGTFNPDDELKAFFPTETPDLEGDALKDMIVKIVHEELSGEIGERITRNVRKLVRREINQILAARKLR